MKQQTNLLFYLSTLLTASALLAPNVMAGANQPPSDAAHTAPVAPNTTLTLNKRKFNLACEQDWKAFLKTVQTLRTEAKAEHAAQKETKKAAKKEAKKEKKQAEQKTELSEGDNAIKKQKETDAEGVKPASDKEAKEKENARRNGRDWSSKKVRAGLDALAEVGQRIQEGAQEKAAGIHALQEISWALESNFITPYTWRSSLDLGDLLFRAQPLLLNGCGRGSEEDPATNLPTYNSPDLSLVDPLPSTFWTQPGNIAAKDLYAGFERPTLPDFSAAVCEYDSPHKGYGVHPSFEVVQNGRHWKVKFGGERSSEPFACRVFWALGFPVEIVDYAPLVKVQWDRRILTDFNSRKLNVTRLKLAGIPLATQRRDTYSDPFDYIRYAILKDGSHIDAKTLRERLLPVQAGHSPPKHAEQKPALYNADFERDINILVMQAASFSSKETEDAREIGFWDYNYLEHPQRREVRGMAALDAWLENYDIRWGNNQLRLADAPDGVRLEHVVSDLGGIFGQSSGIIRATRGGFAYGLYGNAPNEYGWTCTHPQPADKSTAPIQDYMPATKTKPFYEMNLDDARWMARRIAQFTEAQLKTALIAAGYDAPTARILLEKLVSRRDRMVVDFGLGGEIKPLRPNGVNKRLSYNSQTDGPFETMLADGRKITAQDSGETLLVNGLLKPNPQFPRK